MYAGSRRASLTESQASLTLRTKIGPLQSVTVAPSHLHNLHMSTSTPCAQMRSKSNPTHGNISWTQHGPKSVNEKLNSQSPCIHNPPRILPSAVNLPLLCTLKCGCSTVTAWSKRPAFQSQSQQEVMRFRSGERAAKLAVAWHVRR